MAFLASSKFISSGASMPWPVALVFEGWGGGGKVLLDQTSKKPHNVLSLNALTCLASLVSSPITSADVLVLPSVITDGGPNTLSDVTTREPWQEKVGLDRPAIG